ncbi:hypothetical protein GCM10022248_15500 [Nonomuraea soli]
MISIILTALALTALSAVPAHADYSRFNLRYIWLKEGPKAGGGSACVEQSISLGGTYRWRAFTKSGDHQYNMRHDWNNNQRDIDIAPGVYTWRDCITQRNGYYSLTASLKNDYIDYGTAYLTGKSLYVYNGGGWFTFGSTLEPLI